MIEVKNLTKVFDDIVAVNNISFSIKKGEITGFLGPNGAGKSTTLKMLTGYLKPTSGDIIFNSANDAQNPEHRDHDIRKDIGYLPEHNPLYADMLVFDYLKYMAELKEVGYSIFGVRSHPHYPPYEWEQNGLLTTENRKPKTENDILTDRILYVAQRCGITDRLSQMIGTLSRGYKQRVGLAQAILNDPQILILDEPTVGLDPNQIIEIRNLISELGKDRTVILSSHILQEIQAICERILIIHKGNLIVDTSKEQLLAETKSQKLEEAFAMLTSSCPPFREG